MGFPANCSDIVFPRFLLRSLFFLGYIRSLLCCLMKLVGLAELLLDTEDVSWFPNNQYIHHSDQSYQSPQEQLNFPSLWAKKIQDSLPVVKYGELGQGHGNVVVGDSCAVCLCEFEAEDEVRRLSNCRHVFHRGCIDRWTEHEQWTCPLCRTPLVDGLPEIQSCSSEEEDIGVDYGYDEDDLYSFFTLSSSSSLVVPQRRSSALLLSSHFL